MDGARSEAHGYIRLRQICLAASQLRGSETAMRAVLGLDVSHRDERVAKHGLENFVMPLGTSFLEVVAPTRDGTAVDRFLTRDGGAYMAIFDCSNLSEWRDRVEAAGVRVAKHQDYGAYEHLQLHPKDTGATMIEINHTIGGEELSGPYDPGGEDWQRHARTHIAKELLGMSVVSPKPSEIARLWADVLGRKAQETGDKTWRIALDRGFIDFAPCKADETECLSRLHIAVTDRSAVLQSAKEHGLTTEDGAFYLAGVWFDLQQS